MPRLAFVIHSAAPSGAELSLVRYHKRLRCLSPLYVSLADGPIINMLRAEGAQVMVLGDGRAPDVTRSSGPLAAVRALGQLRRVAQDLMDVDVDVIVPGSIKSGVVALLVGRRKRIPVVWWVHDRLTSEYLGSLNAVLARLLVRVTARGLIVNSASTYATVKFRGRRPTLMLPPGIDWVAPVEHRQRHAAGNELLRVAMLARISPWKGQHVLLDALAALPPGVIEACDVFGGTLFGEDNYLKALREKAARGGLIETVRFRGHVPSASRQLTKFDVLVHASTLVEPFGNVVVEGMAAGCIVVAAAAGGPAEVITDGVDGFLYPPGDAGALATVLQRVSQMSGRQRLKMVTRGQETAARYSSDKLGAVMAEWLGSWLNEGPPSAWCDAVSGRRSPG